MQVMHTLNYIKDAKMGPEAHWEDEIEDANEFAETSCQSRSQSNSDEKVNFNNGAMTPLPKQAKHFYESGEI